MEIEELKEVTQAGKRVIKALINGEEVLVDKATRDKRLRTCDKCKFNRNGKCQVCKCYITPKKALATENCPKGYWK